MSQSYALHPFLCIAKCSVDTKMFVYHVMILQTCRSAITKKHYSTCVADLFTSHHPGTHSSFHGQSQGRLVHFQHLKLAASPLPLHGEIPRMTSGGHFSHHAFDCTPVLASCQHGPHSQLRQQPPDDEQKSPHKMTALPGVKT